MKKIIISLLLMAIAHPLIASVSDDLDQFFNGIGYAANVTSPAAFESQAAGFFGGGSLYARHPVRQYQLVQLDLPSYRAGCGGIDLFTGSMSFLSEQKLVDLGKSVMSNAGAYAVDVMLASTVPELKQVRDYLQQLEQTANHASINSCEMAQNLVGGIWPKTTTSQQKICKDQGTQGKEGLFSDYVKARMACSGYGFEQAMEKAATLTYHVRDIIRTINTKLTLDEKPGPRELNFLNMTSLPVMKFLSVLNSTQYGRHAIDIDEYALLIAHDLLTNYLTALLTEVNHATSGSEFNHDLIKEIEKRIQSAATQVAALNPNVGHKLKEKLALIEHIARIEKQVSQTMGSTLR